MRYIIPLSLLVLILACKGNKKNVVLKTDTYYTCSMHPQVMQDGPGKCPICGMELIAVKKGEGQPKDAVMLSDQQVQLGNIQLDTIGKGVIGQKTILSATLTVDETKSVAVNARITGRIEKLYFKSIGDYLHKGDRLYDLNSDELNNAKQEYLLALEKQKTMDNSIIDFQQLVKSAKDKLLLWGLSESQVSELARTKSNSPITAFYSPAEGYISALVNHEGDYVAEGSLLLRLSNLSVLWAEAQVYSSQLQEIGPNANASVQLPDLSKEIKGQIEFVNPEVNPASRINLIRVAIPNPGHQLRPGMQAYVLLKNRQSESLTLPIEAVIRNEKYNTVWLQVGHNTYKSVMVETGIEDGDRIEITSGLKKGDIVVTSGAYLVNSEYIFKHGADPMAAMDMKNM